MTELDRRQLIMGTFDIIILLVVCLKGLVHPELPLWGAVVFVACGALAAHSMYDNLIKRHRPGSRRLY